jgi:hypothetical protein
MKAIVTHAFTGRPDNEALARLIPEGEIIAGDLAAVAVAAGDAEEVEPAVVETPPGGPDLDKMSRADLDALAAERGVDIASARNKAEVIALLIAAEQPAE